MSTFDDLLKSKSRRVTSHSASATPSVQESQAAPVQETQAVHANAPVHPRQPPQFSSRSFSSMFGAAGKHAPTAAPQNVALQHCQPVLRTDQANVWSRIERTVESVYRAMLDACASLGIEAYVGRSNTFEFPFAVFFECWLPIGTDMHLTERCWVSVKIEPKAWHRYEMEYTIETDNRGHKKTIGKFGELNASEIHSLLSYLVRGGPRPRFRARIWQRQDPFWRRLASMRNKPLGRRRDYLSLTGSLLLLTGLIGAFGISPFFRQDSESSPVFGLSLVALGLGVGIAIYIGRQPVAVRSAGQPEHQPRILRMYDSWQAVLFGAASSAAVLRQRFLAVLTQAPIDGFNASTERIGYRVLDDLVSRDQIVVRARRGIIYCQIYEFGSDLYVGWQSFLNQGRWIEKCPGDRVIDGATGRRAEIRDVIPGREGLCEYDYADVNCLTEWTHAQIVMLTKQLMEGAANRSGNRFQNRPRRAPRTGREQR